MIDVYVEYYEPPQEDFTDNLYNVLSNYIFEPNTGETRDRIRLDTSNCFTQFWPEYPLGMVLVDTLSLNAVNVTVKMKDDCADEEVCDVNYECDYYIDYSADSVESHHQEIWEAIEGHEADETMDDILYGYIKKD